MKKIFLVVFCVIAGYVAQCSHIVGGEIFYDCAGNNVYHITLKLYRDCNCSDCAPYGNTEYVTIFDGAGNIYTQLAMPLPPFDTISTNWRTPCFTPPGVCIEEADYVADVTLPANAIGYTLVYQRCCRSTVAQNVVTEQGATFTAEIPSTTLASCNSSARFDTLPPMFICLNTPLSISYAATDPDGDSLVYSLCDPLSGASATCPDPSPNGGGGGGCLTQPNPPPYTACIYNAPYSAANFTNTPSNAGNLTIDPHSGLLTGTPNTAGLFDITVCVCEYRNGQLLNTLRRDYQFTVVACVNAPLYYANAGTDTIICLGDTVILGSQPISGVTYQWENSQGFISDSNTSQPLVVPFETATTYYLLMTDTIAALNGCGNIKTDSVEIITETCTTSIAYKSKDEVNIRLFPNPAKDYTTLFYNTLLSQQAGLEVYNQLGQLVIEQILPANANSFMISTNQLQDGIYEYRFILNNVAVKRDKFVIVK